jgi:hypothetical protein
MWGCLSARGLANSPYTYDQMNMADHDCCRLKSDNTDPSRCASTNKPRLAAWGFNWPCSLGILDAGESRGPLPDTPAELSTRIDQDPTAAFSTSVDRHGE